MNTWDKNSITELLDAMGQSDSIKFFEQTTKEAGFSGFSYGDWGQVLFMTLTIWELRLKFENSEDAARAFDALSAQLSNPYEFTSRFDVMPEVIIVRFTE